MLVAALEAAGYEVFWDGKLNNDDWKGELRDEINRCKMVICLWSASAAASEYVKAEAYHAFGIEKLLSAPIEDKSVVPGYFKDTNIHPFDGWADQSRLPDQLTKILETLRRTIGARSRKASEPQTATVIPVEFGDIPGAPPRLVGRDSELAMLRAAWTSKVPKKVNAVVLHALGGAGKSALLRTFANELLASGNSGAQRIYGWSAYSQGSGEQKRADADGFISKALGDLGFQGDLPKDPVERARALAKLVQRERVLLLLDGLEPLQDPPGRQQGPLQGQGPRRAGEACWATRTPASSCSPRARRCRSWKATAPLVVNHPLGASFPTSAGAELLVELGVRGRQRELEAAVRSVDGHALSVTLLGTYLSEVCGGDIRHRDQFDFADIVLTKAEQEALATDKTIIPAKRADKVMRGYLEQFEKLAKEGATEGLGGPERALLHLLGLFDRPADGKAVAALLENRIPGLTDELFVETSTDDHRAVVLEVQQSRGAGAERAASGASASATPRSDCANCSLLSKRQPQRPAGAGRPPHRARVLLRPPGGDGARGRESRPRDPLPPLRRRRAGPARHARRDAAAVQRRPARRQGRAGAGGVLMRYSGGAFERGNDDYILRVLGAFGPNLATSVPTSLIRRGGRRAAI